MQKLNRLRLKSKPDSDPCFRPPEKLTVACVKWGRKFSADYANRLRHMVDRHLTFPHRFVCLTDNPDGLESGIGIVELRHGLEYCWNKLELFAPDTFSGDEVCLYLDLDVVVTGNIDALAAFCPDDDFIGQCDWYVANRSIFNSSVMRFRGNAHTRLFTSLFDKLNNGSVRWDREFDRYLGSKDKVVAWEGERRFGSDQEWLSAQLYPKGEHSKHSFPNGWIVSHKKHASKRLPKGGKVVVFHGYPKPHEVDNEYVKTYWR